MFTIKTLVSIFLIVTATFSTARPAPARPAGASLYSLYTVDKTSNAPNWIVRFQSQLKVRLHVSGDYFPYNELTMNPGQSIALQPGQWAEDYIYVSAIGNYTWSLMSDADHR